MSISADGPLVGVRIVELAGIGPIQLGGMLLAEQADVLVEGFRPGVAERLGVGPDVALARNPALIYSRMTGWGQEGPLAARAGHDLNFIGLTGAVAAIGRAGEPPVPPLNLVSDFGGGTMFLVVGILAALLERHRSGQGQVIDCAMVDGTSYLMPMCFSAFASGLWRDERAANLLDGGAPFYDVYECSDGKYLAVGAQEPQFFARLLSTLGLTDVPAQDDQDGWPAMRARFAPAFRSRTRDEWAEAFGERDACVTPVLTLAEAPTGAHLSARKTFVEAFDVVQPAPAPRFSRTPGRIRSAPTAPGADSIAALQKWGFDVGEVERLIDGGVVCLPRTRAHDQFNDLVKYRRDLGHGRRFADDRHQRAAWLPQGGRRRCSHSPTAPPPWNARSSRTGCPSITRRPDSRSYRPRVTAPGTNSLSWTAFSWRTKAARSLRCASPGYRPRRVAPGGPS